MQAHRLADLRQRRSGVLRSREALAPFVPRSLDLPLVVKMGALCLGERFPFGVRRHGGSLFAGSGALTERRALLLRPASYAGCMRSRLQTSFGLIVVVAAVGLIVWAFIEAVRAEPAVVGSIAVAVIGVSGIVWQQRQVEKARLREAHRDRMSPVYDDLLKTIWGKVSGAKTDEIDPEVEAFFRDFKARKLTLGASSAMVQAFNEWTDATKAAAEAGDNTAAMAAWEFLLRAIRSDLGHEDSNLPPGELLRLFITDYDEHFSMTE